MIQFIWLSLALLTVWLPPSVLDNKKALFSLIFEGTGLFYG